MQRAHWILKCEKSFKKKQKLAIFKFAAASWFFILTKCSPTVTQILPQFDDGKFWMFSEGGREFIGLEKNSHVCLAIYDKYDGFGNLRSLQVTGDGRAFLGGVQRPCCFQEDPAGRSEKTALTDESDLRDA
mgnify:FL=1